ncbi:MAG: hypothetical protein ACOZJZ_17585 [Pseudomonadota bacterium]
MNLFPGHALERGPAQLYLRVQRGGEAAAVLPLLGPGTDARLEVQAHSLIWHREAAGLRVALALRLAHETPAWYWHVGLHNAGEGEAQATLVYAQDLALSRYHALRLNEYYVSQYLDHTPLRDAKQGWVVATRQNLPVDDAHPWCLIGSLRHGEACATDALQLHGLAARTGNGALPGLARGLPSRRQQHEHAMAVVQDAPIVLPPGSSAHTGFFGRLVPDHPEPTTDADLSTVAAALALPDARPPAPTDSGTHHALPLSLFDTAPRLDAQPLHEQDLAELFGTERREAEQEGGMLLSFFTAEHRHVVLQAKEQRVLRPHGHILRSGDAWVPDEAALTSTVWMAGVFHSMVTQGHVALNRLLSTHRSNLGLYRSLGQRLFVEIDGAWHLLDQPSAWEVSPSSVRWYYRHRGGLIRVESSAGVAEHVLQLRLRVLQGPPLRALLSHHLAMDGDDGASGEAVPVRVEAQAVRVMPRPDSDLARRFPDGHFRIQATPGTPLDRVGGDELLYLDGLSRGQPWLCMLAAPALAMDWQITGHLLPEAGPAANDAAGFWQQATAGLRLQLPRHRMAAASVHRLGELMPWLAHNALVHYLSPRGLEQFSGGGWGTRDVCQGPVEYLLALGRLAPLRELLLKVFRAQNADGDWPQWFAFFERDCDSRAGDSHGDIVFWPLLALGQYLLASGDAGVLDEPLPFYAAAADATAQDAPVIEHLRRALRVIEQRRIPGTALAAYGHGDWNDSLQPADPAMRERLCSAWTVTLHAQTLNTLADGLRGVGRTDEAAALAEQANEVAQGFQQHLVVDGVIPGFVHFHAEGGTEHLLHPRDVHTGLRYSLLAMVHAILNDLLTPQQAETHLALIREHLLGPDGARLFDRPMRYRGGEQRFFQRAETSSFFGREIGLMYMHAHLRYAEALWHWGDAQGFFDALCRFNPIGLRELVPSAALRQANCYYSSSDAAFADRYQADAHYEEALHGRVPLEGGWRVYSSGAGIGFSLVLRCLLGLRQAHEALLLDPVMPKALDGLRAELQLLGRSFELRYRVGADGAPVQRLRLNGQPLHFTREPHRYRCGAARVEMERVRELLVEGINRLVVELG